MPTYGVLRRQVRHQHVLTDRRPGAGAGHERPTALGVDDPLAVGRQDRLAPEHVALDSARGRVVVDGQRPQRRDDRPAREGLPRPRQRARARIRPRRGRHGPTEGQGRRLHRQGGLSRAAIEPPAAILCTLTVDDTDLVEWRQALHARQEPILTPRRRAAHRRQGPPLVRDERGVGAVGRQAPPDVLPAAGYAVVGTKLLVEYFGERYPVTVAVAGQHAAVRPGRTSGSGAERVNILVCVKRVPGTGGRIVLTADEQDIDTRFLGFTSARTRSARSRRPSGSSRPTAARARS